MFPKIKHLNDLLPFIESNKMIRVKEEDNGKTIVCYMLQDEDMFSGEHQAFERECRGITFHPDGTIAARTLHKFHNVGERTDLQAEYLDWGSVTRIMTKRDGCLDGGTLLMTPDGEMTIRHMVETEYRGLVLGEKDGNIVATPVLGHLLQDDEAKQWFELICEDGTVLRLTGNHKVFSTTRNIYVRVDELTLQDELLPLDQLQTV